MWTGVWSYEWGIIGGGNSISNKIEDLEHGDHLCCIYRAEEEHRTVLTPFLRQGLEKNEKVLYIVDKRTAETILDYLRDDGVDVNTYLERGQLVILTVKEAYMKEGVFDPDGMIRLLASETENALKEGYSALRATGEMTWALKELPGSERLIEYESKLNDFFQGSKCLAICQYDMREFSPDILMDVLITHPLAVIGTEIFENFYYLSPDEFLGPDLSKVTLNQWINNLKQQKLSENALRESEELHRLTLNNISDAVFITDDTGIFTYICPNVDVIFGYSYEEVEKFANISKLLGENLFTAAELQKIGEIRNIDRDITDKSRNTHNLLVNVKKVSINEGTQLYTCRDITERRQLEDALRKSYEKLEQRVEERTAELAEANLSLNAKITEHKRMEKALNESEKRFKQVAENADEWIWEIDADGLYTYASPVLEKILGYKPVEVVGRKHFYDLFAPEEVEELKKLALKSFAMKEPFKGFVNTNLHKNGTKVILETSGTPILDEEGKLLGYRGADTDITHRIKAKNDLKRSKERFKTLIRTSPDAVTVTDLNGTITYVSDRTLEIHGFSDKNELLGKNAMELIAPEYQETAAKNYQNTYKDGLVSDVEYMLLKKDGSSFIGELNASLLKDAEGNPEGFIGTTRDITERKKLEEQIEKSLKEKEMLLKEIHHRVKNNLMIISSLLNLQSRYIKDKASQDIFKESQNRARTMALIHERLYQSTDLKRIDFGDYIKSLSTELFRTYVADSGTIELNINVEDILLDINTAIPLGLIVNELVTNSLKHAFPEGVRGEINVDFHPKDNHYEFTVKDNGIGFPEDLDFKNTDSLGLQMVNSLTDQIDGEIELNRSYGSEFKITFKE